MKTLIIFLMLYSSFYCFSQNLRTPEEVKQFNREFIRLINIERKKLNIDTLIESDKLTKSSMSWSRECSIKNFFKHSDRASRVDVAECLTYIYGKTSSEVAVTESFDAFSISKAHWKILMDPTYKFIGVGEYFNITKNHIKDEGDIMPITKVASIVTIQLSR